MISPILFVFPIILDCLSRNTLFQFQQFRVLKEPVGLFLAKQNDFFFLTQGQFQLFALYLESW